MRCLVTGATGYIGGRLAPRLLAEGHQVRCLARRAGRLRDVPWAARAEVAEGDLRKPETLSAAFADVDVAYYLVHSLGQADFEAADREAATHFAAAAAAAGVRRIVYLGGPEPAAGGGVPSPHLRSRAEVARILLAGEVPTVVLRAAVIIGSGSASFEMLRYLTERLPAMVTPRWVGNRIQPIAVRDVLRYLVGCATLPAEVDRAFDIGGPDVLTFREMMQRYAQVAGLRRRIIVPVRPLTPALSSHWVGLITPVPNAIARPLVESLIHEAVAHEHDIARWLPDQPGGLTGFDDAVALALTMVRDAQVETRWSNASGPDAPAEPLPSDPHWSGGTVYTDVREREVDASPAELWRVIEGVGGEHGWYSFPLAWSVRGWLDRLVGGVGLRRGRRDPHRLQVGEALDFWRVEEIVPGELLRLRAEMRLPGRAWLEMRAEPLGEGRTRYVQRAVFLPRGLPGHLYWLSVAPFHAVVFGGMARNIANHAPTP
ncbi:SDR family oxidoreductase [Micromonospora sp. RL09-050-HVF-A]|uniref:SDR family oxidoreductase n=1 Tax=Micromonospora sp. RL09-050-HVF-A TaxID=1703433 RepID=UPI001C5FB10A|nr:SDR family oxidoreductase [Micromonospora sp. RL09-050-HVF-A]MBW4702917.1 SDR family oxidoreductase [Micromonospora sp. RL09-050-HVF-A]